MKRISSSCTSFSFTALAAFGLGLAASCTHPFVVPKPRTADHNRHNAAVTAQIQPYIDAEVLSSVAIGMIDGDHTEVFGFGHGPTGGATPDSDTVFELGSITKVFTALLLIDSVARHEVELTTPAVSLLPLGVTVPTVALLASSSVTVVTPDEAIVYA